MPIALVLMQYPHFLVLQVEKGGEYAIYALEQFILPAPPPI